MIIKMHSRCNINCTYCYMYNLGDDPSASLPKRLNLEAIDAVIASARREFEAGRMGTASFALHGGEPLLVGKTYMRQFLARVRDLAGDLPLKLTMQTNGLLLDDAWCDLMEEYRVSVGISLDLPDQHGRTQRLDFKGRDTYSRVIEAVKRFRERSCFAGVIMVASEFADGAAAVELLCGDLQVPWFDILIPDLTHDHIAGRTDWAETQRRLLAFYTSAFDTWAGKYAETIDCRLFDNLVSLHLGGNSSADAVGTPGFSAVILETDGSVELHDTLRICSGFDRRLFESVSDNVYSDVRDHEKYKQINSGDFPSAEACRNCDVQTLCQGGELAHRYSREKGFSNASVHCQLLYGLISHVGQWVRRELKVETLRRAPTGDFPPAAASVAAA